MHKHPHEQLDIVNEDNEVTGQASRQEIHDKHLLHRAVHLILTTGEGYFLLQQRADCRPTYPGRWDSSASGHVLAGDTFDESVEREAREELSYPPSDPAPVLLIEGTAETDYEWVQFHTERVTTRPQLQADPSEVKDLRWWAEQELVEELVRDPEQFTPMFRVLFFLWRETGFLIPEKQKGNWYSLATGNFNQLQVRRGLLEAAGIEAHVEADQHWLAPRGGRSLFGGRREPHQTTLCVQRPHLSDAIALLYLSRPSDDEVFDEMATEP
jgi:isopentenyl-diphosphate Delta-isomerase